MDAMPCKRFTTEQIAFARQQAAELRPNRIYSGIE
jgi:hypothetical protein